MGWCIRYYYVYSVERMDRGALGRALLYFMHTVQLGSETRKKDIKETMKFTMRFKNQVMTRNYT